MRRDAEQLRKITSFKALLTFLGEKMHWPIGRFEFEEVTYQYDPKKLGLKDAELAKIKSIHQLQPLRTHQPWNIFFIEFETKKIPVAVLRRVLGRLVSDKKQTKKHDAIWNTEDLLFISSTSAMDKEIAFAHFHQSGKDKPTLRVLGWDGGDTLLKLDDLAKTMQDKLRWPDNEADVATWREKWASAFKHRPGEIIRTASELADALAGLAKRIRSAALVILQSETDGGPLRKLHKMVQKALIHDLKEVDFADTFAQTITYGLLTAAIANQQKEDEGKFKSELVAEHVSELVPMTNPLLKELLGTFLEVGGRKSDMDFDELGVQEVVELLRSNDVDLKAIVNDFGNKTRSEDPIIHFYEHFLKAYDKAIKTQRGVFYTPQPVVSYIVRSVHELLQKEFDLEDGLASTISWGEMAKRNKDLKIPKGADPKSHFVVVLDPATGTGTFLIETVEVVYNTLTSKWRKEGNGEKAIDKLWNKYVPEHLLPRLFGYELMMAPYAIAHMRLGLKLHETGYRFDSPGRAQIYLTNSLEPGTEDKQSAFVGMGDALAHEATLVNEVKRGQRFTVVIGNPPYAIHSGNLTPTARELVTRYRRCANEIIRERGALQFEKNLQNDYVKFIRAAEIIVSASSYGVVGFITSHAFLSNRTLRGMRESLLESFRSLKFLNLHGNSASGEAASLAVGDQNIFDITEGVAVSLLSRGPRVLESAVNYADLAGTRAFKNEWLEMHTGLSTEWTTILPVLPNLLFKVTDDAQVEFDDGIALDEIFHQRSAGVITARDEFATDENRLKLISRIEAFAKSRLSGERLRNEFGINDKKGWDVDVAQQQARDGMPLSKKVYPYYYRPFDSRFIAYNPGIVWGMAYPTLKYTLYGSNLVLIGMQQYQYDVPEYCYVFVARALTDSRVFVSKTGVASLFPLYLHSDEAALFKRGTDVNLNPEFVRGLLDVTGLVWVPVGTGDLREKGSLGPESVFNYIYAQLYAPSYRRRFAEPLKSGFPKIFGPCSLSLMRVLSGLGAELVALHLFESPKLDKPITEFIGGRNPEVEKISWSSDTVWIDKTQTTGFKGVPEAVWKFHIGGYQVCDKWLKDRKGRTLSKEDIVHYEKIVVALSETIRIMKEIDEVIEKAGGWPGAFQTEAVK